jgi:hypothetical protein
MVVIRAARSKSSLRDSRVSSVKVRTRIVFLRRFDRANRGLLTEATATETAAASRATGTKRRSASALAAMQPVNGATWPGRRTGLVSAGLTKCRLATGMRPLGLMSAKSISPPAAIWSMRSTNLRRAVASLGPGTMRKTSKRHPEQLDQYKRLCYRASAFIARLQIASIWQT